MAVIRKVQPGDEKDLAFIQTESWKAAFKGIIPDDLLEKCTDRTRAENMYRGLLEEHIGNGYLLFDDEGRPHCIAWWDKARDEKMIGYAELICIHSLPGNWRKGYGSMMMNGVLTDVKNAGYDRILLWVFDKNERAIGFYNAHGFARGGETKPALGADEVMYIKKL